MEGEYTGRSHEELGVWLPTAGTLGSHWHRQHLWSLWAVAGALVCNWWNSEITSLIIWLPTVWTWHQHRLGDFQVHNKVTSTCVRMQWVTVEWQAGWHTTKLCCMGSSLLSSVSIFQGLGEYLLLSLVSQFTHSLKKYLMSSFQVPGSLQGIGPTTAY